MYACTCIILLFKGTYNFYDCIPITCTYLFSHVFIFYVYGHVMSSYKVVNCLSVKTKPNNKCAFLDLTEIVTDCNTLQYIVIHCKTAQLVDKLL